MKVFIKLSIITLVIGSSVYGSESLPPLPPRPTASRTAVAPMNTPQVQFNQALVEQQELNRQQAAAIANLNQIAAQQQQHINFQNQATTTQVNRAREYRNRPFWRKVCDLLAGCANAQF